MKNTKKIFALVLCLMMVAVLLVSCGKSIKGEWKLVEARGNGPVGQYMKMGADVEAEFTKDEMILTVTYMGQSQDARMVYEIKDGKITLNGITEKYEIKGDTLTIYEPLETLIFERK